MKKRIKKKYLTWAVINEIYYYVKEQYENGYSFVFVKDEVFDEQYGFIFITEKEAKQANSLLRKDGYVARYEEFIPRGLGRTRWSFIFDKIDKK